MDSLAYILSKYGLDTRQHMPIEIPNVGRAQLAELFRELGYTRGVEVGTEAGKYAETLCKANPGLQLTCVDVWQTYDGYRDYDGREKLLYDYYYAAGLRLAPYNVDFVRAYSMDAVINYANNSLDFVYIDANHEWPYVTQDIYYWARKVRPGGIVAGHDFYQSGNKDSRCHVKHAVISYCNAFRVKPWFVLGRDARIEGEIRDTSRSWFWVVA
jgi:predicted O-methyltransferase YrrM